MKLPNLFTASAALKRLVIAFLRREPVLVSQDVVDRRLTQCFKCHEYLVDSGQCAKCSCYVEVKVQLSTEKCPLGKW